MFWGRCFFSHLLRNQGHSTCESFAKVLVASSAGSQLFFFWEGVSFALTLHFSVGRKEGRRESTKHRCISGHFLVDTLLVGHLP